MIAGAAASLLTAGCGVGERGQLRLWAMDAEGANVDMLLPEFIRETGIGVVSQALPWSAAHEKLLTAFAGGSLPDVTMLSSAWLPEFRAIGAIDEVPPAARPLLADQFAGVRDAAEIDGRAYGIPWTVGPQAQFYRRDLIARAGLDRIPLAWTEWKAALHAIKRRTDASFAVLVMLDWPDYLLMFAGQQPDPLLRDSDTRGNFRSPGFRTALAFYTSLFDEGLAPRAVSAEIADPITEFVRGWTAIYLSGSWTMAELGRRAGELPRARWATAALPGPDGPGRGGVGSAVLTVPRGARDAEGGWRLIDYLMRPATQLRLQRIAGPLPSRRAAWRAPALANDPALAAFADQVTRAGTFPRVPEWPQIAAEMQIVAERAVRGLLSVDQAAAEIDARVDRILAKRRWMLDRGAAG